MARRKRRRESMRGNNNPAKKLEVRKKIKEALNRPETKEKLRKIWLGKHHSEKSKEKIRRKLIGRATRGSGWHHLPETKKKISDKLKGNNNPAKRPEVRKKMREKAKGHWIGNKNPNWNNGSSFKPYSIGWTEIFRELIRQRYNYICQICGIHQNELNGYHKKLIIHHIDYNKKNCEPYNLITLCQKCHSKTNNNRNYWINYFTNKL